MARTTYKKSRLVLDISRMDKAAVYGTSVPGETSVGLTKVQLGNDGLEERGSWYCFEDNLE